MQLKETINTKKGKKNNENNIKFKFNIFDEVFKKYLIK